VPAAPEESGTNALASLLALGGSAVGSWCTTPATLTVEVLTVDAVDRALDRQHGVTELAVLLATVRGRVTPLVRVPSNDGAAIGRALDLGAGGVIVPMVGTADEARRAVAACRYPPDGMRSYGPSRAGLFLGSEPATLQAHALCFVIGPRRRSNADSLRGR
jgi:4-hydroxy-2-oxoheptanedioate aldolase